MFMLKFYQEFTFSAKTPNFSKKAPSARKFGRLAPIMESTNPNMGGQTLVFYNMWGSPRRPPNSPSLALPLKNILIV